MAESKETPTADEAEPQPGNFTIDVQEMMADYEAQIAAKSRECMMARAETRAVKAELEAIKQTLMQIQGKASTLSDRPVARKKVAPKRR